MTAIRAYEMDLYRRLARRPRGDPRRPPLRHHGPGAVRRPDADGGAHARRPRPAGDLGGARPRGDRDLGRRLLRHGPDRAPRPGRAGRRRPDRADPLQHRRRGRPRRRRARRDRGGRGGRVTGRSSAPDVAIVGGGIVGAATAAFLAAGRAPRHALRAHRDRGGASGRNSGVIQHPFDPGARRAVPGVARASTGPFAPAGVGRSAPAEPAGLLCVGWERGRAAGRSPPRGRAAYPETRPEVVSAQALRDLEPALAPDVVACRIGIGYPVVPAAATRAFAGLAEARGATLRIGRRRGPRRFATASRSASRSTGSVEPAGAVVVAAGPWTPAIVDPSAPGGRSARLWGVVADIALATPPRHVLEEIEIEHEIEPVEDASERRRATVSLQPRDRGRVEQPRLDVPARRSRIRSASPKPFANAARATSRRSPARRSAACAPVRARCALDGRPLVGAVPGIDRAFVAAGNGPWGISTGTGDGAADRGPGPWPRAATIPAALDPARFGRIG